MPPRKEWRSPTFWCRFRASLPWSAASGILLGFHGKVSAWLLVLFLVPVTFMTHNFWALKDPMMQQLQMAIFVRNISMLGAAVFFTQVGTGPLSLDFRPGPAR